MSKKYNKAGQEIRVQLDKKVSHLNTAIHLFTFIGMYTYLYIEANRILGA
jgi:hypothetical protein|tara:strand:- start:994 stop:1143 length:150 start_codon:yes stop_codon:yes gene_type:complete